MFFINKKRNKKLSQNDYTNIIIFLLATYLFLWNLSRKVPYHINNFFSVSHCQTNVWKLLLPPSLLRLVCEMCWKKGDFDAMVLNVDDIAMTNLRKVNFGWLGA